MSIPSTVITVINFELEPNNASLEIAVKFNVCIPETVSLYATPLAGDDVLLCPPDEFPNEENNLASFTVNIYPLDSIPPGPEEPSRFKVIGEIVLGSLLFKVIEVLDIEIMGSLVIFLFNVINLCFIILFSSGNASNMGMFSIASPAY